MAKNPNGILKKDQYVRVAIHSRRETDGLLVPVSADPARRREPAVRLRRRTPTGRFARRRLDVGSQVGDRFEILSGLQAGDQIVVEGGLFMQFAQSQ